MQSHPKPHRLDEERPRRRRRRAARRSGGPGWGAATRIRQVRHQARRRSRPPPHRSCGSRRSGARALEEPRQPAHEHEPDRAPDPDRPARPSRPARADRRPLGRPGGGRPPPSPAVLPGGRAVGRRSQLPPVAPTRRASGRAARLRFVPTPRSAGPRAHGCVRGADRRRGPGPTAATRVRPPQGRSGSRRREGSQAALRREPPPWAGAAACSACPLRTLSSPAIWPPRSSSSSL